MTTHSSGGAGGRRFRAETPRGGRPVAKTGSKIGKGSNRRELLKPLKSSKK